MSRSTDRTAHRVAHRRLPTRALASRSESGAALIFAMVILIVLSTILTALFAFTQTGTRSIRAQRSSRTLRVNADAALDAAVAMVKTDKTLGITSGGGTCALRVPMSSPTTVVVAGSYLDVSCVATTGTTSGGSDGDGGQALRDVTFTVTCRSTTVNGKVQCGSSGALRTVGKARVRFDVDYSWTGIPSSATPADGRARVPKVVSWSTVG